MFNSQYTIIKYGELKIIFYFELIVLIIVVIINPSSPIIEHLTAYNIHFSKSEFSLGTSDILIVLRYRGTIPSVWIDLFH